MIQEAVSREELVRKLSRLSAHYEVSPRYSNQIEMRIPAAENTSVLSYCKTIGFTHLSNIACIDWIADDRFELLYNLWSYLHKIHLTLKVRIPREEPVAMSVLSQWPQAQVYEQEVHEFFGVVFEGNPDLGPLFLHNWLDMPPMRKDFDSEEYSRQAYGFLDDNGEGRP
jgi:NADH-quinone oxidoreductase subunit C